MKAIVFVFLLLGIVACQKDNRVSRKLDGTWTAEILFNDVPQNNESATFSFNDNGKGEGTGSYVVVNGAEQQVIGIEYFIKNNRLTILFDQQPMVFEIVEQSNRELKLMDTQGGVTLLKKNGWLN